MEQEVKDTFPVRLAVVDGDWRYLSNIRDYAALHTGIQQCDTYRNSMELLDALSAGILYHGVIMDLFLQDSTPNVFLDRLNRRNIPNRPVLVFTTTSINRTLAESVLLAGADQVIQKPPRAQDLLDTVLAILVQPQIYLQSRLRERVWWNLHQLSLPADENGYWYLEAAVEQQVKADCACSGKELYPDIARQFHVGEKAVDSAIRRLLETNLDYDSAAVRRVLAAANLPPETRHISNMKFIAAVAKLVRLEICPGGWPRPKEEEVDIDEIAGRGKDLLPV